MTELQYVLENFKARFAGWEGKRILLHGSRDYAKEIIRHFSDEFCFVGITSDEEIPRDLLWGIPVMQEEEIRSGDIDLIILTERVRYAEAAYGRLAEKCRLCRIALYNMYGIDELAVHRQAEHYHVLTAGNLDKWVSRIKRFDLVVFEAVDVFTEQNEETLRIRTNYKKLFQALAECRCQIAFSLRKSFPEETQRECLQALLPGTELPVFPEQDIYDEPCFLIRREGEDLSFRTLTERFANRTILYMGSGLVNEVILPRCYGIETWRVASQFDCLAPVMSDPDQERRLDMPDWDGLRQSIDTADVVSFDLFDTLLARKLLKPEDLFEIIELREHIPGFAEIRKQAQSIYPTATAEELYDRIAQELDWDQMLRDRILALEIELEQKLIYVRQDVLGLYRYAAACGKTVIICSDMYYSGKWLTEMLEQKGVAGFRELFVSCDYGTTKQQKLFVEIRKKYSGRIIHFGDNPTVDSEAEAYGIRFLRVPSTAQQAIDNGWQKCIGEAASLFDRCLLGDSFYRAFSPCTKQEHTAGLAVMPLLLGYTCWLAENVNRGGFDAVLFFARDGWLIRRLYDRLPGEKVKSSYFYTSRHAALPLCASDPETVRYAIDQGRAYGLSESEIIERVFGSGGTEHTEESAENFFGGRACRYAARLGKTERSAREGYRAYLRKNGITAESKYAVSDFYASGSTQRCLRKGLQLDLTGFYAGSPRAEAAEEDRIHYYLPGKNDALNRNAIELECYFSSPEPSVDRIQTDGVVTFSKECRDDQTISEMLSVQSLALELAERFISMFGGALPQINPALIEEIYAVQGGEAIIREAFNDLVGMPIKKKSWSRAVRYDE